MKNEKNPEFYMIFARKILFSEFWGQSEQTRPQHQSRDHGGHRSTGAIVLNELFMHLLTLFYSISLYA